MQRRIAWTVVAALLLSCEEGPPELPGAAKPPCSLTFAYYRVTNLVFPATTEAALWDALNLDAPSGNPDPDNHLGGMRAQLAEIGVEFSTDPTLTLADEPWLAVVGSCPNRNHVRLAMTKSVRRVGPETFELTDDPPIPAVGEADDRLRVSEGAGHFPFSLFFAPAGVTRPSAGWVDGLGFAADLEWTDQTLQGLVGFGVQSSPAANALKPPLAAAFTAFVQADPGCPSACEANYARALLEWFDADADGAISPAELEVPIFYSLYVLADLDYLAIVNGERIYWPGRDGTLDHGSMALRIVAERVDVVP